MKKIEGGISLDFDYDGSQNRINLKGIPENLSDEMLEDFGEACRDHLNRKIDYLREEGFELNDAIVRAGSEINGAYRQILIDMEAKKEMARKLFY
jgi:hypothetical protein